MKAKTYLEVTVACTITPGRKPNPFHWVLLRALKVFVPGARPGFDELASRLRVGERAFLDEAWKEITRWRAADDDDFAQARLSDAGEAALRTDWWVTAEPVVRRHTLYFSREDGRPLHAERFAFNVVRDVCSPPAWNAELTAVRVSEALALQKPKEALRPNERLVAIDADWSAAQEVREIEDR